MKESSASKTTERQKEEGREEEQTDRVGAEEGERGRRKKGNGKKFNNPCSKQKNQLLKSSKQ